MSEQIFHDHEVDRAHKAKWYLGRIAIYGVLIIWTVVCLFPIFWTLTTSFKLAPNVMQGHLMPFLEFDPKWKGFESIGAAPLFDVVCAVGSAHLVTKAALVR